MAAHRGTLRRSSQLTAGAIAMAKKAATSTRPITVRIRYEKYRAAITAVATSTTFATARAETCVASIPRHLRHGFGCLAATPAQGDPGADGKAHDGGADRELPLVLTDLTAPIGELRDPGAERFDRMPQLVPLALDVGADLVGVPARRAGGT